VTDDKKIPEENAKSAAGEGRGKRPDSRECSILRHRVWVVIPEMDAKVKSVRKQSAPASLNVSPLSEV
jgi:hypothetical protein